MIAITGGTGRIGRFLVQTLDNKGIEYVSLVRRKTGLKNAVYSDFSTSSLSDIFSSADYVVHLAGSTEFNNPKSLNESNVELTKRVVDATPDNVPIIFSSSISVYGKQLFEMPADERTKVNPDSEYAKTKLIAEDIIKQHKSIIFRFGTVYGPFPDYAFILRMILKSKRAYIVGDGRNKIPFVYVRDVVSVILKAIDINAFGTFVIVGEAPTQMEVYEIASSILGVNIDVVHVPYALALLVLRFAHVFGKAKGITKEHIDVLYYNRVFNTSKARDTLGFNPTDIRVGIKETIYNLF